MSQDYLIEELKKNYFSGKGIVISDHLFDELFPVPKRPTVDDMELVINVAMGLSNHIHRGEFAHVREKTREEKLNTFLEKWDIHYYEDMLNREHHFKLNTQTI